MLENFLDICKDVTKTATKIPQGEYQEKGQYPIFDQGQLFIGGFTNDDSRLVHDYPYIVFGDHTRIVKYVNESCYIGADGVKLLKVYNENYLSKYIYYAMLANPVDSYGYSRHYKFLKDTKIRQMSIEKQKMIINNLDILYRLINIKKNQIIKYDSLVKSQFIEMFGEYDLSKPTDKWKTIKDIAEVYTGTTPSTLDETNWDGDILWITPAEINDDSFYIYDTERKITEKGQGSLKLMPKDTVLLSTRAPIGKVGIVGIPMCCNQGFKNLKFFDNIGNPVYYYFLLKMNVPYLQSIGTGTTFKEISKSNAEKILVPVPSIDKQNQFAEIVKQIDKSKFIIQQQIDELNNLLNSKMNEYFG